MSFEDCLRLATTIVMVSPFFWLWWSSRKKRVRQHLNGSALPTKENER